MKAVRTTSHNGLADIVKSLRSVPKSHLHIVRRVVQELSKPAWPKNRRVKPQKTARKTLLKTSFCGIWKDRSDIVDSESFAKALRQRLEIRGDRN